ncbi:MAG TPA: efflux RND transporter periplasmic adaptor subunit [Acidobacteriaceae bacterium]|nr:efflux RND transporter periplasmic adaptor subunit [Acidobacteriaceae bacterium]
MKAVRVSSRQWKIAGLFLVAIAVVIIAGVSRREEVVGVLTAQAADADVDNRVTTNGTVIPTSEFQARAFWPGVVQKVDVELGQKVKPGQLLVTMEDPLAYSRIATANANLQAARVDYEDVHNGGSQQDRIALAGDLKQAQLAVAEDMKALIALKQLQGKGASSGAEIASAQQRLDAATANLKTLERKQSDRYSPSDIRNSTTHLQEMRAALDAAKNQFNNANIHTPIGGTVYAIHVVNYDWVPVGTDLIRVADLKQVEVKAYFDEPEIGKLAAGQPVTIRWDGLPGREWHGHIKQAPIAATALGPRSVGECVITVDDSKEDLLPNTNVTVTATIEQHSNVLTVPRAALETNGARTFVYRVIDGRLRWTPVQVGIVNLQRAEIRGGLRKHDVVALNTIDNREMHDGMRVRPVR